MDTEKSEKYNIIGTSPAIISARNNVLKAARTSFSALILGERGTGKELFARLIHKDSSRADKPFVAVNCAAIPESMMDSELFGIEDRAATGVRARAGVFETADGGTVFLDEIADMPFMAQAKILRVLQEREVTRVGGRRSIPVDVRIIAATNKTKEIHDEGKFRADLLDRLNEAPITLPPLRERKGDVKILLKHFLDKYDCEVMITSPAFRVLEDYPWPGNVRELENIAKKIVTFAGDRIRVSARDLLALHPNLRNGQGDGCQPWGNESSDLKDKDVRFLILEFLSQNADTGRKCICSELNISRSVFNRHAFDLCSGGEVISTGKGKATRYRIPGPEDFIEGSAESQGLSVLDSRQKVLERYLNSNGQITREKYEKLTGVSTATACRDLREMVESGFILKNGAGRFSTYLLNSDRQSSEDAV